MWVVSSVNKSAFSHLLLPSLLYKWVGFDAGLPPSVPHVLTVPISIDVGDRSDDIFILFNVLEEFFKPARPQFF